MKKLILLCSLSMITFFSRSATLIEIENELKKKSFELQAELHQELDSMNNESISFHENRLKKKASFADRHFQECSKDGNSEECKKVMEEWKSYKKVEEKDKKRFEEHRDQKGIFAIEKAREQNPKVKELMLSVDRLKKDRAFALFELIQQNPQALFEIAKKVVTNAQNVQISLNEKITEFLKPITQEKLQYKEKSLQEESSYFQKQDIDSGEQKKKSKRYKRNKQHGQIIEGIFRVRLFHGDDLECAK